MSIICSTILLGKEIRLATVHEFPPYSFNTKENGLSGIDIEIITELFKQINKAYSIKPYPVQRAQYLVEKQSLDGMVTTTPYMTDKLSESLWRSDTLYTATVSIFINRQHKPALNQRLSHSKFCVSIGFLSSTSPKSVGLTQSDYLDVRLVQRLPQLVNLLVQDQVDCVIAEDISFIYQAKLMKKADQVFLLQELADRDSFITLNKNLAQQNPQLTKSINSTIAKLQKDQFIDDLIIKYLELPLRSWKQ
ncbi:substrate-binding periplasmic protein [Zooshikella harenae]|uniref:Transporter substrate-binding domain-containing protein n=1 Tax=Zooshikella harenae TaxID=2827238 RepID=A0ABS5Z6E3_9GAMM|nr:transporter substrate-binding domain-containing protein [Zooshikella harenae]MBU2709622.1 transporter substrate-binding domain-containing protein [Zooshikella harenae]